MKKIRYSCEAVLMVVLVGLLRVIPLPFSSALGGATARMVGPHTRINRVADYNMQQALPEMDAESRRHALRGMWNNLGRVLGEYPHLPTKAMAKRLRIASGAEHVDAAKAQNRSIMFISAHFGNWECLPLAAHVFFDAPTHLLYRPANNPVAEWLTGRLRRSYSPSLHGKGTQGARATLQAVRKHEHLAMLVDQKTNDGMASPFFGHEAMTTTVVAQLALKYGVIILPCYCLRREGTTFEIHVEAPLDYTGMNAQQITDAVNHRIEGWIRQYPEQWFWVHKRWPHSKAFARSLKKR